MVDNRVCPRGEACTFAHSVEEMERYRARSRLMSRAGGFKKGTPAVATVAPMPMVGSMAGSDHGTAAGLNSGLNSLELPPAVTPVISSMPPPLAVSGRMPAAAMNPTAPLGYVPAPGVSGVVGPGFVAPGAAILGQPHVAAQSLRFAFVQSQMQTGAGATVTPQLRGGDPSVDYNCLWLPQYVQMGNTSRYYQWRKALERAF